jgi:hypothetical protein
MVFRVLQAHLEGQSEPQELQAHQDRVEEQLVQELMQYFS